MRPGSRAGGRVPKFLFGLLFGLSACAIGPEAGSSDYLERRDENVRAEAYGGFQRLLAEWGRAVADNAVDRAHTLYTPDARVRLDYLAIGPEIRPALVEWFEQVDNVIMGPADFDFSGSLAYGVVRVLVIPADGGPRRTGIMTVVARVSAGRWLIRGQYLAVE